MTTSIFKASRIGLDSSIIARWRAVPTTIVADLFQGTVLVNPRIRPLAPFGDSERLIGRAVTVHCEPPDFGSVLHAVALAQKGDIIAIAADGNVDVAVLGELLGGSARAKGVAGVICDGAVRDIGTLARWRDFPVFALGNTARGPSSKAHGSVNETITLGGVRIEPGFLIIGDDDGIVVFSPADAVSALPKAEANVKAEHEWELQLAAGKTVLEVFAVPAPTLR